MPQFISAYKAYETIDEYGRAGAVVGYFEDDAAARNAVSRRGWFGGAGGVSPALLIVVDGRCYPVASDCMDGFALEHLNTDLVQQRKDARQVAWEKITASLSAEEIKLLDLAAPK